ncbi:hypothetical protein GUY44_10615 [Pimelobacter simplex]|uniref:hypothetical protein n=1 Tax=Nocardioides simplex TaxID=2045 RepID=UPI001141309B|nr:hypothetical protein [Pimelobacter simplex]MCG8150929.1 hypothetical protein [Pimelobacter simplex]GEB12437.1 hypothetical protein NSI01_07520 [Pimelobacter simplex]
MATAPERAALREVLLSSGFDLVEKTRDRGDGSYSETFQNGTNEVEIRWGPRTDDRLEFFQASETLRHKKCGDCGQQTGSIHSEGCFRQGEWVGAGLISHLLL